MRLVLQRRTVAVELLVNNVGRSMTEQTYGALQQSSGKLSEMRRDPVTVVMQTVEEHRHAYVLVNYRLRSNTSFTTQASAGRQAVAKSL